MEMRALFTAIIYFGMFLLLGWWAKRVLDKWTAHNGKHPSEVQGRSSESSPRQTRFLLGAWYK
jgi:hypothetical protein